MSVRELAAAAQTCGGVFIRDPFSGRVTIANAERIPPHITAELYARWGDLEAILSEMSPPDPVTAAMQILRAPQMPALQPHSEIQ